MHHLQKGSADGAVRAGAVICLLLFASAACPPPPPPFNNPSLHCSTPALPSILQWPLPPALLPPLAARFVTYKWPSWLHKQTEKQRIIWAYKILFLDVLFPLGLKKASHVPWWCLGRA